MSDLYVYRAMLVRVVDGDTYDMMIDPGFYLTYAARVRLKDYDTPELRRGSEYEKQKAQEACDAALAWFNEAVDDLMVRTHKADSFGRWLADPFYLDGNGDSFWLSDHLCELGLASEWPTRWHEEFDHTLESA